MNIDQTKRMLEALVQRLGYSPAELLKFANIVAEERKAHFDRGEGPDGEKWAALSPRTILAKSREHHTTRVMRRKGISGLGKSKSRKASATPSSPLIDTGMLRNVTSTATNKVARIKLARGRSENVGPGYSISEIHDKGLGRVPQRRHWGIPKAALERIIREHEYIQNKRIKEIIEEFKR